MKNFLNELILGLDKHFQKLNGTAWIDIPGEPIEYIGNSYNDWGAFDSSTTTFWTNFVHVDVVTGIASTNTTSNIGPGGLSDMAFVTKLQNGAFVFNGKMHEFDPNTGSIKTTIDLTVTPNATITTPTNSQIFPNGSTVNFAGTATCPGDTAKFYNGTNVIKTAIVASNSTYSTSIAGLAPGTYTITVKLTDPSGNENVGTNVSFTILNVVTSVSEIATKYGIVNANNVISANTEVDMFLYSTTGQLISKVHTKELNLNTMNLSNGMYIINVHTSDGVYKDKISILK
jgi:hypothetical protein